MVVFATCVKHSAIDFLKQLYPSQEITEDKISKLLKLLDKDIVRVQDPNFHKPAQIISGDNYKPEHRSQVNEAIKQLKENLHG